MKVTQAGCRALRQVVAASAAGLVVMLGLSAVPTVAGAAVAQHTIRVYPGAATADASHTLANKGATPSAIGNQQYGGTDGWCISSAGYAGCDLQHFYGYVGHGTPPADSDLGAGDYRMLFTFPEVESLPRASHVVNATLVGNGPTTVPVPIGAYALTTPWTGGPSWTSTGASAASAAWQHPGGDYAADGTVVAAGGAPEWDVTAIVQQWLNGSAGLQPSRPDDGLILAAADGAGDGILSLERMDSSRLYLSVTYETDTDGPSAPSNFDATYDQTTARTLVTWDSSVDPPLGDGAPGSGVASYNYRYQLGSGAWTSWMSISAPWFGLVGSTVGQTIGVEVQAVDNAGNVGPTASESVVNAQSTLTADNIGAADPGETGDAPLDPEPSSLPTDPTAASMSPLQANMNAIYTESLCSDGGPCGTYDGDAASSYAIRWQLNGLDDAHARSNYNPNYDYFGGNGGDCTNFASQSLKAGGMKFMRAHGDNDPDASSGTEVSDFLHGEGSWWSYWNDPDGLTHPMPREYGVTESFVRAPKLFSHLIDYGLGSIVGPGGDVHPGDIVFYNLSGTSLSGIDHSQVVTRVTSRAIWVTQHSPGYTHTLKYVFNQRIDGEQGVDWQYWIVHPKYTAANITA